MAIDTTGPRTRRAILLGAVGAVAASTAGAVVRPMSALADGDDTKIVHVGDVYGDVQSTTSLENSSNNSLVFSVRNDLGGDAFSAFSASSVGVSADSDSGIGVFARCESGRAVWALSTSDVGVYGHSVLNSGVSGASDASDAPAVSSWSKGSNTGVYGFSGAGAAGPSPHKTGVCGVANMAGGTGVVGRAAAGRGGSFAGGKAQLRLQPSSAATHPTSGATGDLFLDSNKRLWFCLGGTSWKRFSLV
jgi:hypothetical protein